MKKLIVFSVVAALLVLSLCIGRTFAEAPVISVKVLRETKEWDADKVQVMIRFIAREYNYNAEQLICLAGKESSLGEDKRCGDSGKSCFLFQIQKPTWDDLTTWMNRKDLVYSNYVDQTIVTGWAIEHGYGYKWPPLKQCK